MCICWILHNINIQKHVTLQMYKVKTLEREAETVSSISDKLPVQLSSTIFNMKTRGGGSCLARKGNM